MQGKQGQSSVRVQGQSEKSVKNNVDRDAIRQEGDIIDSKFGFDRMKDGPDRWEYENTISRIVSSDSLLSLEDVNLDYLCFVTWFKRKARFNSF